MRCFKTLQVWGTVVALPLVQRSFHQNRAKLVNSLVASLTLCSAGTKWELNFYSTTSSQFKYSSGSAVPAKGIMGNLALAKGSLLPRLWLPPYRIDYDADGLRPGHTVCVPIIILMCWWRSLFNMFNPSDQVVNVAHHLIKLLSH
jgi:hypothetical protein